MTVPVNPKFLKLLEEQNKKRREIDFFILVWGSGSANPLASKKREKMISVLKAEFGEENVFMSEDPALSDFAEKYGDIVAESMQLDAIDFVILLDTSIGPHIEAHEYFQKLGSKSIVLCSEEYAKTKSFPANIRYKYNIVWFDDKEFSKCNLVESITGDDLYQHCFRKATLLREKKYEKAHFS
jgi:hypothetical protein